MKEISISQAVKMLSQGALLVDVREHSEVEQVAYDVPNFLNIPLGELAEKFSQIPTQEQVIVACKAGGRSAKAVQFLQEKGFTNVINLQGGMIAWAEQGFPIKTK
ncbi:rhodanese-like domain-containing protein [Capnocytophaga catalasegens]|uniref:Rhodanese domain-containing protein n=1 Tax=Capnocytophaga catalasegens TaxID=1004260 RepID=A0AAV5AV26_9FLAO|nr:rhodanese-like domain-containing protein [Capnocytophaga catalasegens]GIZ15196.1 hypothetical protein RCZ03_11960 [Capnocytophaga catalasegens]GJM49711.1 hypothetical protein RCZ15_06860 [Capnocytophaga catalasegens]GJM52776.1 hypothetical protein RCZ16_10930 [Capnocytophaga catalasegens]